MTKKLNTEAIANELEGASLFFTKPTPPPSDDNALIDKQSVAITPHPSSVPAVQPKPSAKPKEQKKEANNARDTTTPRHHDTTVSRYHDTTHAQMNQVAIELIRKAVKEFGKEAATHRFTESEKKQIADLIYTYKNQGIRTSENEITRIAVNFIIEDYRENGENSVLHKILHALNE